MAQRAQQPVSEEKSNEEEEENKQEKENKEEEENEEEEEIITDDEIGWILECLINDYDGLFWMPVPPKLYKIYGFMLKRYIHTRWMVRWIFKCHGDIVHDIHRDDGDVDPWIAIKELLYKQIYNKRVYGVDWDADINPNWTFIE